MKLRSTTLPASISRVAKSGILLAFIIGATIGAFAYLNRPVSADQYQAKINALSSEMARFQAEANRLNGEAVSLSNTIAQITNEKNALQAQVDISQAKHDKLVVDIADTEKKIELYDFVLRNFDHRNFELVLEKFLLYWAK